MKTQDKVKLHQLTPANLKAQLDDLEQQLVDTRLKLAAGRLKDIHAATKIRHHIAAVKTILHQKLKEVK